LLHIYSMALVVIFLLLYLMISSYITSKQETEDLFKKVSKWKKLLTEKVDKDFDFKLQKLIKSDISDLENLIYKKFKLDDEKRDDLNKRKDELPSKSLETIGRVALAYKLNKK